MPSSIARETACSWSAAAPLIISPPTAPQPKPSTDRSRPVLPNLRFSTDAASALPPALAADQAPVAGACQLSGQLFGKEVCRREIARQSHLTGAMLRNPTWL